MRCRVPDLSYQVLQLPPNPASSYTYLVCWKILSASQSRFYGVQQSVLSHAADSALNHPGSLVATLILHLGTRGHHPGRDITTFASAGAGINASDLWPRNLTAAARADSPQIVFLEPSDNPSHRLEPAHRFAPLGMLLTSAGLRTFISVGHPERMPTPMPGGGDRNCQALGSGPRATFILFCLSISELE